MFLAFVFIFRFIDYGNVEEKAGKDLMVLPAQLAGLPPLAQLVQVPGLACVDNSEQNMDTLYGVLRWDKYLVQG